MGKKLHLFAPTILKLFSKSKPEVTAMVGDVDHNAWDYMRRTRKDGSVKTPLKMVTRSNA
jgi:hypothetical protein